jgi:hypothetical protein
MSIRDFHAQLVSGNNKNSLFAALRQLSMIADPKSLFDEEPAAEWPIWNDGQTGGQRRAFAVTTA